MSREKDGRRIVESAGVFPYRLREGQRRVLVSSFRQSGKSVHGKEGITLSVILEYCIANAIPFVLRGSSKFGFVVKKISCKDFDELIY